VQKNNLFYPVVRRLHDKICADRQNGRETGTILYQAHSVCRPLANGVRSLRAAFAKKKLLRLYPNFLGSATGSHSKPNVCQPSITPSSSRPCLPTCGLLVAVLVESVLHPVVEPGLFYDVKFHTVAEGEMNLRSSLFFHVFHLMQPSKSRHPADFAQAATSLRRSKGRVRLRQMTPLNGAFSIQLLRQRGKAGHRGCGFKT
jgi:hypothetical protein